MPIADAQQKQQEQEKPHVSGAALPADKRLVHTEERVEYRDQDGNLLNEEQVKALEGKVEFKTRYETRTRLIDAQGNEVFIPGEGEKQEEPAGVAPPHPDVQGMFLILLGLVVVSSPHSFPSICADPLLTRL